MKKMIKLHELQAGRLLGTAAFTLTLVLSLWLFAGSFSIVSHAESAGRVSSASGAKVRSSASTSGTQLTSWPQNQTVTIRSQMQGSDGYTWYEVLVEDGSWGYVRSDLIEITDGTTPPAADQVSTDNPSSSDNNTTANGTTAGVSAVNPVSATVINGGSSGVRIRSTPSTDNNSQVITNVQNGLVLTVIGQANGTEADGKVWYQVNFSSDSTEVTGFIRSDYVQLSEELTPYTEPEAEPEPPAEQVENTPEPQVQKDYDTILRDDGEWLLVINTTDPATSYEITSLLSAVSNNTEIYEGMDRNIKTQKIAIVVLVFLLVIAVGAVGFLVFKIKDMTDSAYFNEIENETLRRRSAQGGQRPVQNSGSEKRGQGQRPAGPRPAGAPQGQRPNGPGQRPAGASQGQRPAGGPQGQRPAGQRTSGAPQGQKPAGAPQGQRPIPPQGQRPSGGPQGQKPAGSGQGQRPAGASQGQTPAAASQSAGRPQPKNFMADEDEFEFEFLNYEGDDEQ